MNDQHVKGGVKQFTGRVKEEIGHKTGNLGKEIKGVAERVEGKVQSKFGDLKDKAKEVTDEKLEKTPGKKIASLAVAALTGFFVASTSARAVDNEVKATSDTSKNPVTGTVTHTRKFKKHHKHANGKTSDENITDTVKHKKDGSVEEKVDANSDVKR